MLKATIAKWAIAAALAVPAVPMFGKTIHHRPLTTSAVRTHRPLVTRHHRLVTRRHKLSTHRKLTTHAKHRLVHKTGLRSTQSTTPSFKVHVTKMPPTIDGINT